MEEAVKKISDICLLFPESDGKIRIILKCFAYHAKEEGII